MGAFNFLVFLSSAPARLGWGWLKAQRGSVTGTLSGFWQVGVINCWRYNWPSTKHVNLNEVSSHPCVDVIPDPCHGRGGGPLHRLVHAAPLARGPRLHPGPLRGSLRLRISVQRPEAALSSPDLCPQPLNILNQEAGWVQKSSRLQTSNQENTKVWLLIGMHYMENMNIWTHGNSDSGFTILILYWAYLISWNLYLHHLRSFKYLSMSPELMFR